MTAGKASTGEAGSREQQHHIMPIQRKSSLRWVLSWWVDLSIDKDSINSASAKFRFRIIQTSVFYLPPPPVNSIPKTPNVSSSFLLSLYHTEYSAGIFHHWKSLSPSAFPPFLPNKLYFFKKVSTQQWQKMWKILFNFSTIVFDPHICDECLVLYHTVPCTNASD